MSSIVEPNMNDKKWNRIVLFHAVEHADPILLWGEPVDPLLDVGLALSSVPPKDVKVRVWQMVNPEDVEAHPTDEVLTVKTLFCPVDTKRPRPKESLETQGSRKNSDPKTHTVTLNKTTDPAWSFTHMSTQIVGSTMRGPQLERPSRKPLLLPDISQCRDSNTFSPAIKEDEEMILMLQFTVLMSAGQGPISENEAIDYVVGYTWAVSTAIRTAGDPSPPGPGYQGIDAFCPFGPVLVSTRMLPDPGEMSLKVAINGEEKDIQGQGADLRTIQRSAMDCMNAGHSACGGGLVMHGSAAGHLGTREPAIRLRKGDKIVIEASHGIGHLVNSIYHERVPAGRYH